MRDLIKFLESQNSASESQAAPKQRSLKSDIENTSNHLINILNMDCNSVCDQEERDMQLSNIELDISYISDELESSPEAHSAAVALVELLHSNRQGFMAKPLEESLSYIAMAA